jgi:glutaminyl-tRNA synthetase
VPFSRELYIERDDFREDPPKKYFRLAPGAEVRLRYAYLVRCTGVVKDPATGEVKEIRGTIDPDTLGRNPPDGRKVKGTIHWVSAAHAAEAEVRFYDRLFKVERPDDVAEGVDWKSNLNPDSLRVVRALVEPELGRARAGNHYQFERRGYFFADPVDSMDGAPVFNQIVPLRDTWAKIEEKAGTSPKG